MNVASLPVSSLALHPQNPRHGDVSVIAESLQANGQFKPIVVSEDGVVLAGNHTLQAATRLGWSHIDAVILPLASDSPEALRIMAADNRTADGATYDERALLLVLGELAEADAMAGSGYGDSDLADLQRIIEAMDVGTLDYDAEWVDMPAHETDNLQGAYRATFTFNTLGDAAQFFADLGIPELRKSVRWPMSDGHVGMDHTLRVAATTHE